MALLNFLYKDIDLANSLYAQMFNGLMQSIEQAAKSEDSQVVTGKMSCAVAGGGLESKTLTGNGRTEKTNPHDTIFIDVLKYLEPHYKTKIDTTNPGDVLFAQGMLYILDNEMFKLSFETFGIKALEALPDVKKNKQFGKMIIDYMKKIIDYPKKDSKYILLSPQGKEITGIVKNESMSDSIASVMMKFGPFPINPVYMVGIVEDGPAKDAADATNPFPTGNMNQMAIEVAKMFFTTSGRTIGAISVKPLAIFQQINLTS